MDKKEKWTRYFHTFLVDPKRKVTHIDYQWQISDCLGTVWVTDLQFQPGRMATGYLTANRELLKRNRDAEGKPIRRAVYNGVIRGHKTIAVPNRAKISEDPEFSKRVTGGIDFQLTATQSLGKDGVHFSHQHGQRPFTFSLPLRADERLDVQATKRQVTLNGLSTRQYQGHFHTCPAGFGVFQVELRNRDEEPHGSGRLICEVDLWLKGIGGEQM
ncbi:hypothetical protein [Melghirimyces algeriensis]|nr:hypothetical protein [Melghirimyces algeriensis]